MLRQAAPSETKFERLLEWLQFLLHLLEERDFSDDWELTLKQIYGTRPTWRSGPIIQCARQLAYYFAYTPEEETASGPQPTAEPTDDAGTIRAEAAEQDEEDEEGEGSDDGDDDTEVEIGEPPEGWEAPRHALRTAAEKDEALRELRRELAAEHSDVATEYQIYRLLNIDYPWHLRFSLCAPQGEYWGTAIWQEQSLGQQIESTLRMIVNLKKGEAPHSDPARGASRRQHNRN